MNALMIIKSLRICECLAADVTGVRPLPSVALLNVSDHLLFPEKTFAADMANMCFFPCVGLDVAFEVLLFLIPLRAQMTGKGFFASTYHPVPVTIFCCLMSLAAVAADVVHPRLVFHSVDVLSMLGKQRLTGKSETAGHTQPLFHRVAKPSVIRKQFFTSKVEAAGPTGKRLYLHCLILMFVSVRFMCNE